MVRSSVMKVWVLMVLTVVASEVGGSKSLMKRFEDGTGANEGSIIEHAHVVERHADGNDEVAGDSKVSAEGAQRCACERNGNRRFPDCTMSQWCKCNGMVRYGYGSDWTPWRKVEGKIKCVNKVFGDPVKGKIKECQCVAEVIAPPLSETVATGQVRNMYFQGTTKSNDRQNNRPGYVKFKLCPRDSDSGCQECESGEKCGWERRSYYHMIHGKMQVSGFGSNWHLDTNDGYTHVADYWLDCAQDGKGQYYVQTNDVVGGGGNSEFKVYLVEENGHMSGRELPIHSTYTPQPEGTNARYYKAGSLSGNNRISVVISPKDPSKNFGIELRVEGHSVDDAVADCLDNKMCLKTLDGSADGRQLRESSALQLQCLQGQLDTTACDTWVTCLTTNQAQKDLLFAILTASLSPTHGSQLAQHEATTEGGMEEEVDCVHPSSDDPESWECECAGALYDACEHRWFELTVCMKEMMCGASKICQSWKEEYGCPGFLLSKDNESMQEKELADGNSLEESLLDKRSC